MNCNSFFRSIALLAAVALAVPAFAKPVSKTVHIAHEAKIGQTDLQSGDYRFSIDGNKVTVQKGSKTIAEIDGRWEDRSTKSQYDSVLLGEGGVVKEVRFAGQQRVLVLNE